jgi:hypothetical protein
MFNAPFPAAAAAMRKQAVDTAVAPVCEPEGGQPNEDVFAAGATSLRDQAGMRGAHTAAVVAGQVCAGVCALYLLLFSLCRCSSGPPCAAAASLATTRAKQRSFGITNMPSDVSLWG